METSNTYWAELDDEKCPCQGRGWAEIGTELEQCPLHFEGQLHPDTVSLLFDDPKRLQDEERKSKLKWHIAKSRLDITDLQTQLKKQQARLVRLELELVNRTVTAKQLPAVAKSLLTQSTITVEFEDEQP
jgi:hypothetical protein